MPIHPPEPPTPAFLDAFAQVFWFILAVAGGIARFLDAYLRTGVFPTIGMMIAHAVVSGFSGYMVAQVVLKIAPDWTLVAAGVGGYLGTQGIDWIASVLKSRVESAIPASPEPVKPAEGPPK